MYWCSQKDVAVYLRIITKNAVQVNLIYAKARLAPKMYTTIPRLELLGVLIVGYRASQFVTEQLGSSGLKQMLLTDSTCVLEWIKSKKKLKRFVKDKIDEIWKFDIRIGYVESESNPADIATRGESMKKLKSWFMVERARMADNTRSWCNWLNVSWI